MKRVLQIAFALANAMGIYAQPSTNIRLNQVGFFTKGPKVAAIIGSSETEFSIKSVDRQTVYHSGTLSGASTWAQSGESVKTADFSEFTTAGSFVLEVPNLGYSYTFTISNDAYVPLNRALIKAFYYNRTSTALLTQHAGIWARSAGHPDDKVIVHAAAASTQRPAGTVISVPKGWYDAGDYNSYIVNSGISTYTLLLAYEQYNKYYDTLNLNIPESNNNLPDILDEIKWNLDWMLSMQDPNDGGVYTKKTNAGFDGSVMPVNATKTRYVVQKSTAAAFDFAAVMAVTYRIFKKFDETYANTCLAAAKTAYAWGVANPNVTFTNPAASGSYPAVTTGGYGDSYLLDEYEWAANELYLATKDDAYYNNGFKNANSYGLPGWPNVRTLGLFSLIHHRKELTAKALADTTNMKNKLFTLANNYTNYQKNTSPYKIVIGQNGNNDFGWGSNSGAGNQAMLLINAYLASGNQDYLKAAVSNVDYLLGRNAVGYSFVTGIGSKAANNVHHRPTEADGIAAAVPGWLSGGPSGSVGDGCPVNNTTYLAISWVDQQVCYTKNEVAINWNAPAAYITGALELYKVFNDPLTILESFSSQKIQGLQVYPVPASELVQIQMDVKVAGQADMQFCNTMGQVVYSEALHLNTGSNELSKSVQHLHKGIYLLKIKSATEQFVGRLVVE